MTKKYLDSEGLQKLMSNIIALDCEGNGISIDVADHHKKISAKIDNDTIKFNSEGELYAVGGGSEGYIPDEKTIIINSEGKMETAVGGWIDAGIHYEKGPVTNQPERYNHGAGTYGFKWDTLDPTWYETFKDASDIYVDIDTKLTWVVGSGTESSEESHFTNVKFERSSTAPYNWSAYVTDTAHSRNYFYYLGKLDSEGYRFYIPNTTPTCYSIDSTWNSGTFTLKYTTQDTYHKIKSKFINIDGTSIYIDSSNSEDIIKSYEPDNSTIIKNGHKLRTQIGGYFDTSTGTISPVDANYLPIDKKTIVKGYDSSYNEIIKTAIGGYYDESTATYSPIDNNYINIDKKTILNGTNGLCTAIGGWLEEDATVTKEQAKSIGTGEEGELLIYYWPDTAGIAQFARDNNLSSIDLRFFGELGSEGYDETVTLAKQENYPYWSGYSTTGVKVQVAHSSITESISMIALDFSEAGATAGDPNFGFSLSATLDVYHKADNNYIDIDNSSIQINSEGKLKAVPDVVVPIDGNAIIYNDDDKLTTELGGYTDYGTEVEQEVIAGEEPEQILTSEGAFVWADDQFHDIQDIMDQIGWQGIGVQLAGTINNININDGFFASKSASSWNGTTEYGAIVTINQNSNTGEWSLRLDTAGTIYESTSVMPDLTITLNGTTPQSINYIKTEYIPIDNDTIIVSEGKLKTTIKEIVIDDKTIIENSEGKIETRLGGAQYTSTIASKNYAICNPGEGTISSSNIIEFPTVRILSDLVDITSPSMALVIVKMSGEINSESFSDVDVYLTRTGEQKWTGRLITSTHDHVVYLQNGISTTGLQIRAGVSTVTSASLTDFHYTVPEHQEVITEYADSSLIHIDNETIICDSEGVIKTSIGGYVNSAKTLTYNIIDNKYGDDDGDGLYIWDEGKCSASAFSKLPYSDCTVNFKATMVIDNTPIEVNDPIELTFTPSSQPEWTGTLTVSSIDYTLNMFRDEEAYGTHLVYNTSIVHPESIVLTLSYSKQVAGDYGYINPIVVPIDDTIVLNSEGKLGVKASTGLTSSSSGLTVSLDDNTLIFDSEGKIKANISSYGFAEKTYVDSNLAIKQDILTAGHNIFISSENTISAIQSALSYQIVTVLPATPSTNVIYLISAGTSEQAFYNQWMYIDNAWAMIGSTEINLDDYYNKTETDTKLNNKLSLSGGTMTGPIISSFSTSTLASSNEYSCTTINGGTNGDTNSAYLQLNGKHRSSDIGCFLLTAANGSNSTTLKGSPNGTLIWGSKFILFSDGSVPISNTLTCNTATLAKRSTNADCLVLTGGPDYNNGQLWLYGGNSNYTQLKGAFEVIATDGDNSCRLTGKPDGTLTWDSSTLLNKDNADGYYLQLSGGEMKGPIDMGNSDAYTIKNVPTPIDDLDAVNKTYVDTAVSNIIKRWPDTWTGITPLKVEFYTPYKGVAIWNCAYWAAEDSPTGSASDKFYIECFRNDDYSDKTVIKAIDSSTGREWIMQGGSYDWGAWKEVPQAAAANVGSANIPVYLKNGVITSTGKSFANYLPLAGGTMTGAIKSDTYGQLQTSGTGKRLILMGGGGSDSTSGANLYLLGKTCTSWPKSSAGYGGFALQANDGTNSADLLGSADGTLTWNGSSLLTSASWQSTLNSASYSTAGTYTISDVSKYQWILVVGHCARSTNLYASTLIPVTYKGTSRQWYLNINDKGSNYNAYFCFPSTTQFKLTYTDEVTITKIYGLINAS